MHALYLLIGILLLTAGGEALIRGALGLANRLGVSPLLTGLVVVGFGTSTPELIVSLDAALSGEPDIAIGNVIGSNIANILLILGLCALITPLAVTPTALGRDAVVVILSTLLYLLLAAGRVLSTSDGLMFLLGLGLYVGWAYLSEKDQSSPAAAMHTAEASVPTHVPQSLLRASLTSLLGLGLLIGGSRVLLQGAVGLAQSLGVSEALIGLTLVAVGTSLPELTISVVAALRKQADVAVGNILGSNIFNLLGILGLSALVQPLTVSNRIHAFDQWVMLGVALLAYVVLYTGRQITRWEGGLLLGGYLAYAGISYAVIGG